MKMIISVVIVIVLLATGAVYYYSIPISIPNTSALRERAPVAVNTQYCSDGTMDENNLEQVTTCLTEANKDPARRVASIRLQGDLLAIMESGTFDHAQMLTLMTDKSRLPEIRTVALKAILSLLDRGVITYDFVSKNEDAFLQMLSENEAEVVKIGAINYLTKIYYMSVVLGTKPPLNIEKLHERVNAFYNTGSEEVSTAASASIRGNLPVKEDQKMADLVNFVPNYKDHAKKRLNVLLSTLYFLKANKISNAEIVAANTFVCSLDKLALSQKNQTSLQSFCSR